MNGSENSEKTKMMTRHVPTIGSRRATTNPPRTRRRPRSPLVSGTGAGSRTLSSAQITRRYDSGVDDEHPRGADRREHRGADDRADHAGAVHLGGVQGDGAGQVAPADEGGEQRAVGRTEDGLAHADQEHDRRPATPWTGCRRGPRRRAPSERNPWRSETVTRSRRRSKTSASRPPTSEKRSSGPSWANSRMPTNVGDL